ncbi:hypothetical protein FACS1894190_07090 [Spirochaetia bacterium]|nr:hypothetical protein FACS1894190_07090 [Spirochaetia bacterium]
MECKKEKAIEGNLCLYLAGNLCALLKCAFEDEPETEDGDLPFRLTENEITKDGVNIEKGEFNIDAGNITDGADPAVNYGGNSIGVFLNKLFKKHS